MEVKPGIYIKDCSPDYPWAEQYTVHQVMKNTVVISNFCVFDDGRTSESGGIASRYPLELLKQQLSDGFTFKPIS